MLPFISVVIPTRNRGQQLLRCFRSLSEQDYPANRYELVIVNDGGELLNASPLANRTATFPVTILTQSHAGPATARNYGARQARGELLAFTDDDCTVSSDWLQVLARRFDLSPASCIGGRTLGVGDDQYATASEVVLSYFGKLDWGRWGFSRTLTTENLALPAERFLSIGGFDETFLFAGGEDRDFCDRWLCHGWELQYAEDARVFHAPRPGLLPFLERHFRYGRGAYQFSQARLRRGGARLSARAMSLYWELLRSAPARGPSSPLSLPLLIAASQFMTACGFLWQRARWRPGVAPLNQAPPPPPWEWN